MRHSMSECDTRDAHMSSRTHPPLLPACACSSGIVVLPPPAAVASEMTRISNESKPKLAIMTNKSEKLFASIDAQYRKMRQETKADERRAKRVKDLIKAEARLLDAKA
jgi:hypothetical protein